MWRNRQETADVLPTDQKNPAKWKLYFLCNAPPSNHGNIITQGIPSLFLSVKFLSFFNDSYWF